MEQKLRTDLADLKKPASAPNGARGWGVAATIIALAVSRLAFMSHDSSRTDLGRDRPMFAVPPPGVPMWQQRQWESRQQENGVDPVPDATQPSVLPTDELRRWLEESRRRPPSTAGPTTEPASGSSGRDMLLPPEFRQTDR